MYRNFDVWLGSQVLQLGQICATRSLWSGGNGRDSRGGSYLSSMRQKVYESQPKDASPARPNWTAVVGRNNTYCAQQTNPQSRLLVFADRFIPWCFDFFFIIFRCVFLLQLLQCQIQHFYQTHSTPKKTNSALWKTNSTFFKQMFKSHNIYVEVVY